MNAKCSSRDGLLKEWKPKRYQIEDEVIKLEMNKMELLGKPEEKDKIEIIEQRIKQCEKILKKLRCLRKDNWLTDPDLPWSEKLFHLLTWVCGFIILFFTLSLLWRVATKGEIQGIGLIALVVVLMILIIFSFLCISGRGLKTVEELEGRIKEAELIKLWGFTIRGFHRDE